FSTLLSSQGADAHRRQPFGWSRGQPTRRYAAGFAVSNPEVCRTTRAHDPKHAHWARAEGKWETSTDPARPARRPRPGTRYVTGLAESNPFRPADPAAVSRPSSLDAGQKRSAGYATNVRSPRYLQPS